MATGTPDGKALPDAWLGGCDRCDLLASPRSFAFNPQLVTGVGMSTCATSGAHRAPALRRAIVAVALLTAACERGPAFEGKAAAIRIGACAGHVILDGVSRPTLADRGDDIALQLPPGPGGTLEVAAALRAAPGVAPAVHCRATFAPTSPAPPVKHELTLTSRDVWTETAFDIPARGEGAFLLLACDDPAVVWAQPVLLPKPADGHEPLIVLLSLDTLRADHVEGFGNPPVPTPTLGRLVKNGLAFTAAVSPYTWTLPAHYSLFYSRLYGFPLELPAASGLARRLADEGFATAALTGGGFVSALFGFELGFDRYAEIHATGEGRPDIDLLPEILSEAESWIDAHAGAPSFLFLHTYAVHELTSVEKQKLTTNVGLEPYDLSPEEMDVARKFYGELVGRADSALSPFVEKLERIAQSRPTLLVVVSDHGEAFHEHSNVRHGSSGPFTTLHDEVVRVPIIFWAPGVLPAREPATYPFSLLDVAPTLLAAAGLPASPGMTGRDFWPLLRGTWREQSEADRLRWNDPVLSYKNPGWGAPASYASRTAEQKQIVNRRKIAGAATLETYDLRADPMERANLTPADDGPRIAAATLALKEQLRRLSVVFPEKDPSLPVCPACRMSDSAAMRAIADPCISGNGEPQLDPKTRERLKALGYLD
jgi:arylsulfatase A-like enzyme